MRDGMRLAIADPPYPPSMLALSLEMRASRWYSGGPTRARRTPAADAHPEARVWDDPARHRQLMNELLDAFDGWAIATSWDAPAAVYAPLPVGARILVWHRPNSIPTGNRIQSRYETVIVWTPETRRSSVGAVTVPDVLICPAPAKGFAGAKPAAWTRWVLDALGYDPDTDTVVDLFPGSGAVTRELAQQVLL